MSGLSGDRIACPKCRVNNFVGQPQCWQCHAPLPPPEAVAGFVPTVATRQAASPLPAPATFAPPPSPSVSLRTMQWVVGVAAFAVVLLAALLLSRRPSPVPVVVNTPPPALVSPAVEPAQTPASAAPVESVDEVTAAAQREIRKFREENGGILPTPPPSDSDGRIHLRSGGSISREQWDAARQKVKDSPLFKDPPPPGPL